MRATLILNHHCAQACVMEEDEEERRVNRRNEKQENKQNASLAAADVTYQADTTCATHTRTP